MNAKTRNIANIIVFNLCANFRECRLWFSLQELLDLDSRVGAPQRGVSNVGVEHLSDEWLERDDECSESHGGLTDVLVFVDLLCNGLDARYACCCLRTTCTTCTTCCSWWRLSCTLCRLSCCLGDWLACLGGWLCVLSCRCCGGWLPFLRGWRGWLLACWLCWLFSLLRLDVFINYI